MSRTPVAAVLMLCLLVPAGLSAQQATGTGGPPAPESAANQVVDPALLQALEFRFVGPYRGGRAGAVAGVPQEPHTFYLGASGGLFKTVNAGETWENLSDEWFEVSTIGAIAVAPSDPNVVYVGTGQKTVRSNVSIGRGIYRSTDAGRSWQHIGLRDAGQISKILVHPTDPDTVWIGVIGNPFGPNETRGVFRSRDGGANWEKVLYFDEDTGIADMALDVHNPRVLYAAAWTAERKPWTIISGGEDDGLYKSTDAGDTWERLGGGLPEGLVGKIGIGLSEADPNRIYALVEAEPEAAGLYRSDDAGATWERIETNQKRNLITRSWYYTHVYADPVDINRVYVLAVGSFVSVDGGHTFERFSPPHGDGHDLWINPDHPDILAVANDGGVQVSLDRSRTWSTYHNQPTAELYNLFVDNLFPYRIYAPQQDNSTISLPSRFLGALSPEAYWQDAGGCESAHIGFDPDNPTEFYAGCYGGEITRFNIESGDFQQILAYYQMEFSRAPRDLRYRFNWNAPIRMSPHDSDVVYHAAQKVLRTTDGGVSWTEISPDLTTDDPETQDYSGAPITRENTGAEVYNTIFAFEESPAVPGLLWAGSDDGRLHVSRDAGDSWADVTPPGLPARGTVNMIELSAHDPGRVLVAAKRFMLDDFAPYVFLTDDYGASWRRLTGGDNGIPGGTPVRVVREDPEVRGLLYAGTEFGLYVSFDEGAHWQRMQAGLPPIPITDMRVHRDDLVLSTQGRGAWILDDVTPLGHARAAHAALESGAAAFLFPPRDTVRIQHPGGSGPVERRGDNPVDGVQIRYALPPRAGDTPEPVVELEIRDAAGGLVRRFASNEDPVPNPEVIHFADRGDIRVAVEPGTNEFVWNFRVRPPVDLTDDAVVYGLTHGPRAAPGEYLARLLVEGEVAGEEAFRIVADPRLDVTGAAYAAQMALGLRMHAALDEIYTTVRGIRDLREQLDHRLRWARAAGLAVEELENRADAIRAELAAVADELIQPLNSAYDDLENFEQKLDNKIGYVYSAVDSVEAGPTQGQAEVFEDLRAELDGVLARYRRVLNDDVAAWDAALRQLGGLPIQVPEEH